MNSESVASPISASAPDSPAVLTLADMNDASRQWLLTLHPTHLALAEPTDPQPFIIVRNEVMRSVMFMEGMRALVMDKPLKLTLKLTPEGAAALVKWIGEPVLAGFYLGRRYAWVLPIAIISVVANVPVKGSEIPFDPVEFATALLLLGSWAFAKWRPHPALFLADSLWFLIMAGNLVMDVIGGRSKWWLLSVAFMVWMVFNGVKHFVRFKGFKVEPWSA